MQISDILKRCDHTLLTVDAKWEDVAKLCDEAVAYDTASVCIAPCYVKKAYMYLDGKKPVCTVVGFPNGYSTIKTKAFETRDAIEDGASEIDMVINIGALKAGDKEYLLREIGEVRAACRDALLKVIIETCLLTDDEIAAMCKIVTDVGADYIKTSTGFSSGGATEKDVRLMKSLVGKGVKVKAAGGIRTLEAAEKIIEAGADRIGASRLVKLAQQRLNQTKPQDNNDNGGTK